MGIVAIQRAIRNAIVNTPVEPFFPLIQIRRRAVPETATISVIVMTLRTAGFAHLIDFTVEAGKAVAQIVVVGRGQLAAMAGAQIVLLGADRPQLVEGAVRLPMVDPPLIGAVLKQIRQMVFLLVQVPLRGVRGWIAQEQTQAPERVGTRILRECWGRRDQGDGGERNGEKRLRPCSPFHFATGWRVSRRRITPAGRIVPAGAARGGSHN